MNVPSSLLTPFLGFKDPKWSHSSRSPRLGFVSQMIRSLLAALQFLYVCSDHFHLFAVAWSPSGHCPCCCPCCCQFFSGLIVSIPPSPETTDLYTAHRPSGVTCLCCFLLGSVNSSLVTQLPTSSNLPATIASIPHCSLGKYFSFT